MNKTSIEWTDFTWNPVTGCNKISQGCKNCYAATMANRFWGNRKFTDVIMHEERLWEPELNERKWKGKKVFVCSMSDLFHESVSKSFIYDVLETIYNYPDTTFQILTKRPARAKELIDRLPESRAINLPANIWIGTSCEDQATADLRIPLLLKIPAAVRFLSCEPLLGPIDLWKEYNNRKLNYLSGEVHDENGLYAKPIEINNESFGIHWVIAGGESGHGARPMHPEWVRSLRDQCESAKVPFFFKQWGNWVPVHAQNEIDWPKSFKWICDVDGKLYNNVKDGGDGIYQAMFKVSKAKAGHLLDGKEHHAFPCLTSNV